MHTSCLPKGFVTSLPLHKVKHDLVLERTSCYFDVTVCLFMHFAFWQVSEKGSLTADEFAKLVGMSVLLAKER